MKPKAHKASLATDTVNGIAIRCAYGELRAVGTLQPHPKNPSVHPESQIELLAKAIKHQGFRSPVVVSKRSGLIVAGHGRLTAAKLLGMDTVPVDEQDFASEVDELAHLAADNRLSELSEIDETLLKELLTELNAGAFNMDVTGFEGKDLKKILESVSTAPAFTKTIESPVYNPSGEKPAVTSLCDTGKADLLLAAIAKSRIPDDVKAFLRLAAYRHTVFDFGKIADFYSHSPAEVQRHMESSVLVIIDFKKAIEDGFVILSDHILKTYVQEEAASEK